MDSVTILDKPADLNWDYDREADVLYVSVGPPVPALGVDIGDGLVLRYDEPHREIVGFTIIGLKQRLLRGLGEAEAAGRETT